MIDSILKIIGAALSIWESKEKTKYADELKKLKTQYYEELKKEPIFRDSAVLDDVLLRLRILSDSVASAITGTNS